MPSLKELKLAQQFAAKQQQLVTELEALVKDIERCEKTITDLQNELGGVNAQYPSPRSTQQDVAYLTDLLKCANKKLVWEKQVASLQKRTPLLLEKMSSLLDDPKSPPAAETRAEILRALQQVQAAVERLQNAKMGA